MNAKLKPIPSFPDDEAAEDFVANADLTQYDLSQFKPMRFEIARKEATLNVRLPALLLDAVRTKARAKGIPYARYVRMALETELQR